VWECCKDDHQSQWERVNFDPQPTQNPLTDRHQIWITWLRRGHLPPKKLGSIRSGFFLPICVKYTPSNDRMCYRKIFAVLVDWYHHIVLTLSFKLVSIFTCIIGYRQPYCRWTTRAQRAAWPKCRRRVAWAGDGTLDQSAGRCRNYTRSVTILSHFQTLLPMRIIQHSANREPRDNPTVVCSGFKRSYCYRTTKHSYLCFLYSIMQVTCAYYAINTNTELCDNPTVLCSGFKRSYCYHTSKHSYLCILQRKYKHRTVGQSHSTLFSS